MPILLPLLIVISLTQSPSGSQAGAQGGPSPGYIDYSRKLDEYGAIPQKEEAARLDDLATELRSNPEAIAYLIVYAGRRACVGEAGRRARWVKSYLVGRSGLPPQRVIWKDGGYREEPTVEVWLTSKGGAAEHGR